MKYKALSHTIFSRNNLSIIPIREEDMESIRIWRNSQMDVLRQKNILTEENQKKYFQDIVVPLFSESKPKQLLFSYLEDGILIGYGGLVNISWEDMRAEMSFLMNSDIASMNERYQKYMSEFISLIKILIFEELNFNRLFTETYEFRKFHIQVLLQNGFIEEGILREQIIEKGIYYNSIIHSILKKEYVKF